MRSAEIVVSEHLQLLRVTDLFDVLPEAYSIVFGQQFELLWRPRAIQLAQLTAAAVAFETDPVAFILAADLRQRPRDCILALRALAVFFDLQRRAVNETTVVGWFGSTGSASSRVDRVVVHSDLLNCTFRRFLLLY